MDPRKELGKIERIQSPSGIHTMLLFSLAIVNVTGSLEQKLV